MDKKQKTTAEGVGILQQRNKEYSIEYQNVRVYYFYSVPENKIYGALRMLDSSTYWAITPVQ